MKMKKYKKMSEVEKELGDMVLCNSIIDIDASVYDNMEINENIDVLEIYQYYLLGINSSHKEWIQKKYPSLIFSYSEKLDLYVLCVDFIGMSWEDVKIEEV